MAEPQSFNVCMLSAECTDANAFFPYGTLYDAIKLCHHSWSREQEQHDAAAMSGIACVGLMI